MRLHRLPYLLSLLAILALCGCATLSGDSANAPHALTILHTNDHHGRFWKNEHGEHGLAARKVLADRVRTEVTTLGGDVLLLDAGDINTGAPESDMLDAEPDIRGMNAMGYDAMVVGNHEFDNALSVLRQQEAWMDFPLLAANIYDATGQRLFTPYHFFTLHGLKMAVFGLTTETTAVVGNPKYVKGLIFRSAVDEARDLLPLLRARADVVIALTHLGYEESGAHGSVALARAVPGIDLIVDGHSHTALTAPVIENGTIIVQAGEYGKYLGRVDLLWEHGRARLVGGKLMPVNLTKKVEHDGKKVRVLVGEPIAEDSSLLALLSPYQERGDKALLTVIGSSDGNFTDDRALMRGTETDIGNLACLALLEKTGTDVAVMNSGGIRAGLGRRSHHVQRCAAHETIWEHHLYRADDRRGVDRVLADGGVHGIRQRGLRPIRRRRLHPEKRHDPRRARSRHVPRSGPDLHNSLGKLPRQRRRRLSQAQ